MPNSPTPTAASLDGESSYEAYMKEQQRLAAQTFEVGDLVRLGEFVGTKAQAKVVWKVERRVPVAGRTDYAVVPVTGGRGLRAQASHLVPASEADKARYANAPEVPKVFVGTVIEVAPRTLRGAADGTRFVVLNVNTDGTVKVAVLGGDEGRYYPKCPIAACKIVTV